jgi:superfamily II DNA/RNA helicase
MLENVRLCGYEHPTAVQSYAIPAVLANLDVIAVAQTGMCCGAWCLVTLGPNKT